MAGVKFLRNVFGSRQICSLIRKDVLNCTYKSELYACKRFRSSKISSGSSIRSSSFSIVLTGVGLGALVGAGYSYHQFKQSKNNLGSSGKEEIIPLLDSVPDIKPSRKVVSTTDNTGLELILFQYPTCPFCCKVRAFLDYYGFSYDVIEVNPVLRQQISWSQYKKVPILLAKTEQGYQQLIDSSMIISALGTFLHDREQKLNEIVKFFPQITFVGADGSPKTEILNRYFLMYQEKVDKKRSKDEILDERKWRKWADDVLVHTLSPNVYRTREEALHSFNRFSEVGEWEKNFPAWERYLIIYVGSLAMWMIGHRLKKRYCLKDDVRQSLYDDCNFWVKELNKKKTPYHGGQTPDLADLSVYGVLNSIEGCQAFKDLLQSTKIGLWYYNMQNEINNHRGSTFMSA